MLMVTYLDEDGAPNTAQAELDALIGTTPEEILTSNESPSVAEHAANGAAAVPGIAVRYLYGDKEKCFESYAERETRDGRRVNARRDFWERFNNKNYEKIGALELKDYRVDVFNRSGTRRSVEEIAELLRIE